MLWAEFGENKLPNAEMTRLMSAGILPSDTLWGSVARILDEQRTDLLQTLELTRASQSMTVASEIKKMPLPNMKLASGDLTQPKVATAKTVEVMAGALRTYDATRENLRIECLCKNLNPPCLPCEDPRVILASFGWEDCKVVDLCILVRKFVLTPNNLRYWIPGIGAVGDFYEKLCCGSKDCDSEKQTDVSWNTLLAQKMAIQYAQLMFLNCGRPPALPQHGLRLQPQAMGSSFTPEPADFGLKEIVATLNRTRDPVEYIQAALDRPEVVQLLKTKLNL
jgi:hypothetical protein